MLPVADVESAYRFILGREPESPEVVAELASRFPSREALRRAMLDSVEFNAQQAGNRPSPASTRHWPPNAVEVEASPADLAEMLAHVERVWQQLGSSEPFWSVLTHDAYRSDRLEENKAAFYASGEQDVGLLTTAAARAGIAGLGDHPVCFEFGCGVGRLTAWLAPLFRQVIACDISAPHLAEARAALEARGIDNVELRQTATLDAIDTLPPFDVFFSLIVLQHNPPAIAFLLLGKILGKLRSGGLAYFQIPTHRLGYRFSIAEYLAAPKGPDMEMHCVPQTRLFELFARSGCRVLEVREDEWTGDPSFVSNSFLLRKD